MDNNNKNYDALTKPTAATGDDANNNDIDNINNSNHDPLIAGVVIVDDADGTFVQRGKVLAQKEQEALVDGTTSLQHTAKLKSTSESESQNTEIDRELGWRTKDMKLARLKNALAKVPGVVAVDNADRTFVRRGKILAQMEQEALADGTSSLHHISKLKSTSESETENSQIDQELGWQTREVKRARQKNALAMVPGIIEENNAEALAVGLSSDVMHEEGEDSSTSQQIPNHYKDISHDVRVRRADGMAERIQHAQYRADAARLRNKYSLENEEKVAEDDDSFAAPGTVEFVRNGSEVSHGWITLSMYNHKERTLI